MSAAESVCSEEDVARFQRDGVVCLRGAITPEWIEALREGVEENLASPGPYARYYTPAERDGFFFGDYCNWARIEGYRRFAFDSPAAAIAAALMGSAKVNLFHEHVLVKEPNTEEPTPWHHDQPYWVVDGAQVMSLWVPLDPVPRESAVEFIAGSHRAGHWFTPKNFSTSADHDSREGTSVPDVENERDRHDIVGFDMAVGDCVAFHALTLHGAPGNRSASNRRRAVALRFTGDDARFTRRDGYMSPPFPDVTLADGSLMDSDDFPIVFPNRDVSRGVA